MTKQRAPASARGWPDPSYRSVRVMKVLGFVERRGASEAARALFEDLSAPIPPASIEPTAHEPRRDPGAGRPTKQERRALDRMRRLEDD